MSLSLPLSLSCLALARSSGGLLPQKWVTPENLCPGMLVMRTKKWTSSKLFGPDLLSGKWVTPANLPGDVGGETQKADIPQVVCPKNKRPLRSRHVLIARSTAPQLFGAKLSVRKFCSEMGHLANVPGGNGCATQNADQPQKALHPMSGKALLWNNGKWQLLPGVHVVQPKRRTCIVMYTCNGWLFFAQWLTVQRPCLG